MNVYASSGFNSSLMQNTKSAFVNTLPFENSPNVNISFKSARLDTRVSFIQYSNKPRLVVKTRGLERRAKGYIENVDYTILSSDGLDNAQYTVFKNNVFESDSFRDYLASVQQAVNSLAAHPSENIVVNREDSIEQSGKWIFSITQGKQAFKLFFLAGTHDM